MTKYVGKAGPGSSNRLPQPGSPGGEGGGDDRRLFSGDNADAGLHEVSCRDVRAQLGKFHRGQLSDDVALHRAIDRHLSKCQGCYTRLLRLEIVSGANLMADAMIGRGKGDSIMSRQA